MTSHSAWAEQKERELEDEKYQRKLKERREALQKSAREDVSKRKYEAWLMEKDTKDRALDLLGKMSEERRKDSKMWFGVAMAIAAVDRLRSLLREQAGVDEVDSKQTAKREFKPLTEDFIRWSRDAQGSRGHEFENVPVDPELGSTFSLNAQEIMKEYAEQMERPGEYIIPSLKYQVEKIKQAVTDKRNLFNPDKAKYNSIYNQLVKQELARAREELEGQLSRQVRKRMDATGESVDEVERRCLQELGLIRMSKWVEEDAIRVEEEAANRKREEKQYAKKVHEGFVKKKEMFKIRLGSEQDANDDEDPEEAERIRLRSKVLFGNATNLKESTASKMVFGKGSKAVRPMRVASATSTLDLVDDPSKKYAYATNRRDLELARQKLKEEGHVYKENFTDVDGDALHDEYREAQGQMGKKDRLRELVRQREEKAQESYKTWSALKELRVRALEALRHVDKPGKTGQGAQVDLKHWRFVGEQLKAVDVTLLGAWSEWSQGFKTAAQCKVTWDSLPPNVCDTCCPSSAVHKVLLKLLNRPGVNFVQIFDLAVDRQLRKNMYSDGRDLSDATPEEREQVEKSLQLGTKEFTKMMLDGGIVLQPHEVRILMTLFDEDGDEKISRKEFLQLVGTDPRPGARGEALPVLRGGNFCCWEQACHVTGLTTAYEVLPAGGATSSDKQQEQDGYSTDEDFSNTKGASTSALQAGARELPLLLRNGRPKTGWIRAPLPDLGKRIKRLLASGDRAPSDMLAPPPRSCEQSSWGLQDRQNALDGLERLAQGNREASAALAALSDGEAPLAPVLSLASAGQSTLTLAWRPAEGSMFPSFYVLETSGVEGGKDHRAHTFREVLRDPPSAQEGSRQRGGATLEGYEPGKKYYFRLRAINGYGPSGYTHAAFATAPEQPPLPVVKSSTPTTLTLDWGGQESAAKKLARELRDVFLQLCDPKSKQVDRDLLLDSLEKHFPQMVKQLDALPSAEIPGTSVLGMLEAHGGEGDRISWQQVQGWISSSSVAQDLEAGQSLAVAKKSDPFLYTLCRCVSDEEVNFAKEGAVDSSKSPTDVAYAVLRASDWCNSRPEGTSLTDLPAMQLIELPEPSADAKEKPALRVILPKAKQLKSSSAVKTVVVGELGEPVTHLEVFEQAYVGGDTCCTLSGLEPGKSYQFRLLKQHSDAPQVSAARLGPALVVHMPEQGHAAPTLGKAGVSADSVHIVWGNAGAGALPNTPGADSTGRRGPGPRTPGAKDWEALVRDWVRDPESEATGGVSDATVRKAFMRYDLDSSGSLDSNELGELFADLGLPTRGPVFEEALHKLDSNGDGTVSYAEFARWWRDQDRKFVVLLQKGDEDKWKVVYRGANTWAKLSGLEPNTFYSFCTQVESNKGLSARSKKLSVYTSPETPQQPAVVEAGSKTLRVKWYPGHNGAEKYQLELLQVDSLSGAKAKSGASAAQEWRKVYEGSGTLAFVDGLQPDSVYRLRVRALNKNSLSSTESLPSQVNTQPAAFSSERVTSKANAASFFSIECTGDIVSGDTILFTERVFDSAATLKSLQPTRQRGAKQQQFSASLSQQSVSNLAKGEVASQFVTERTVAARCLKTAPQGATTLLSLEVIWSTVSVKDTPQSYMLKPGQRVSRTDADIFRFETFRAPWAHEQGRWTRAEEQEQEK